MKKFLLTLFLILPHPLLAMTSRVGTAQDMGVGVAVGQPMGLSAKYWTSSTTAIDAFAGYHFHDNFDLHADYLWHSFSSFRVSQGRLPFYFGLGGRIHAGDNTHLGLRMPIGASYLSSDGPLEFFAEVAPVLELTGGVDVSVDGQLGVRVYLNYTK